MSIEKVPETSGFWRTGWVAVLCIVFAVAALVFILEPRVHALQWLPLVLLLACPIMHFFMHRGHGHGGTQQAHGAGDCCRGMKRDERESDRSAATH